MVEFDVKLVPRDLFRFNMYQTYSTLQGPAAIVLAIIMLVVSVYYFVGGNTSGGALYGSLAVVFVLYIPVLLSIRAKATLKSNEVLAGVLHYNISDEGIRVTSGDDSGLLEWNLIFKLVSTKDLILIYSNRVNAYIIPKSQLGDNYEAFKEVATRNLESFRLKLK